MATISSNDKFIVYLVDASEAGPGNLEVVVHCAKDGSRIPNFLEAEDRRGRFCVYFTPHEDCYNYRVDVSFNDQPVQSKTILINNV